MKTKILIAFLIIFSQSWNITGQTLPGSWKTSWIGTTYGYAANYPLSIHVQNYIEQMYVGSDGRTYTNSQWDEGGRNGGVYNSNGTIELMVMHENDATGTAIHGVGVTVNDNWAFWNDEAITRKYFLNNWSNQSSTWTTVTYATGSGKYLAADNTCLYASGGGTVQVWDINGKNKIRDISIANCGQLTADRTGNFWVVVGTDVQQWSKNGSKLKTITGFLKAKALAVGYNTGYLYVCDNGPRQIKVYNVSDTPNLVKTIGDYNGISSGVPGEVKPLKFWDMNGVGEDVNGNIYVGLCAGSNWDGFTLRKFQSDASTLVFNISDYCFVDNADFEPGTDGQSIWGCEEHYNFDYSRPNSTNLIPENNHFWLKGYTIDSNVDPNDPRIKHSTTSVMCRKPAKFNNNILLYMTSQNSGNGEVFKVSNEMATHVATLPITAGNTLWADDDGDVWFADGTKIFHIPLTGIDGSGNPVFGSTQTISYSGVLNQISRIVYLKNKDMLILSGYSNSNPVPSGSNWDGTLAGNTMVRISNWSSSKNEGEMIKMPFDNSDPSIPNRIMPKEFAACDDKYAFVSYVFNGGTSNPNPPVKVFDMTTQTYIGEMYPKGDINSVSGWVDMVGSIKVMQRSTGEYICLVEEDYQGKIIMYKWSPTGIEGTLSGTFGFSNSDVNLSSGTADWKHFSNNDHKASGTKINSISNFIPIGGAASDYSDDLRKISWTDGTPTESSTNNQTGVHITGPGKGFSFTAAARNDTDTLNIYVSGNGAGGTLTAHLSNYFAPDFERTVATSRTGKWAGTFTLIYDAKQNGKTLDIKWVQATEKGNIGLQAASISGKTFTSTGNLSDKSSDIQVYPNPFKKGLLSIKMAETGKKTISIIDITGKTVFKVQSVNTMIQIPRSVFNKGIYLVNVSDMQNIHREKLIVQ